MSRIYRHQVLAMSCGFNRWLPYGKGLVSPYIGYMFLEWVIFDGQACLFHSFIAQHTQTIDI